MSKFRVPTESGIDACVSKSESSTTRLTGDTIRIFKVLMYLQKKNYSELVTDKRAAEYQAFECYTRL